MNAEIKKLLDEEKYDITIKSPGTFFIFGEHSVMYGQPALCMSLPSDLSMYVQIKKTEEHSENLTLKLDNYYSLDPVTNMMLSRYILDKKKDSVDKKYDMLMELINSKVKNYFYLSNSTYRIKIISAIPARCGLNTSGAIGASISFGLHILENKLEYTEKVLDKKFYGATKLSKISEEKDFDSIFQLAYLIDSAIQSESSGVGPFLSLIGAPKGLPILYISKINEEGDNKYLDYCGCNLCDICKKDSILINNIKRCRYALLYSGKESKTADVFGDQKDTKNTISNYSRDIKYLLNQSEMDCKIGKPPISMILYEGDSDDNYLSKKIWEVVGGYSLIALATLNQANPHDFLNMINIIHKTLSSLKLSSKDLDIIHNHFCIDSKYGTKLTGSGQGGDLLVLGNEEIEDKFIEKIHKTIKNTYGNMPKFFNIHHTSIFLKEDYIEGTQIIDKHDYIQNKSKEEGLYD